MSTLERAISTFTELRNDREGWKKPAKSIEEILEEIKGHVPNDGTQGRIFEIKFRNYLLGEIERVHPQGVADAVVKSGVTLEIGQGCKALTSAVFANTDEALDYWYNSYKPMHKASHVAYSPTGNTEDKFPDTRIYSQAQFIAILEECRLIRAKKNGKDGMYKIAIQSFKFKGSDKKEKQFKEALQAKGETPQQFIARMFA